MEAELARIIDLLRDLDGRLDFKKPETIYLIGGGAITLAYDHENRTADLDFIDPPSILEKLGGKGSALAKKHGIYVSSVYEINFSVPADWKSFAFLSEPKLKNLKVFVACLEDIVLGKLARMEPKDLEDLLGLHRKGFLDAKKILMRLRENAKELANVEYRNNVKLLFDEIFGMKIQFAEGQVKFSKN
ncbi:MAG: DUF6036 family nucleotidyltransferase [Deltaproteobacteria bacterium]|nr:DUF6036 family nucleotidyltransferase [Deltaproteobacteria bacterium]